MDDEECVLRAADYRDKEVIFTKAKWEEKRSDHPELNKETFMACIKRAITEPDEVWEDYNDRARRRCYYKKYSSMSYAKAVVFIAESPCRVVTAYEISYVKETKYPDLKRVR